ncbi:MAG TPA: hypothetical protein VFK89_07160, partial [Actinomycetota bacterium]|nr:hypothetical protein [Actinomycetota bacterium]
SVFLLLSLVLGARLAYFVTASIAFAFMTIMGVVWAINPLGPLGEPAVWNQLDIGSQMSSLKLDAASQYPDGDWITPNEDDTQQVAQASELESDGTNYVTENLGKGDLADFPQDAQLAVTEDSARLLEQGDTTYGAVLIDILPPPVPPELGVPTTKQLEKQKQEASGAEEIKPLGQAAVVMKYDPGNLLGKARMIALGSAILFLLHLIGLSLAERRVRTQEAEATA